MLKSPLAACLTLALASPLALATEKPADKAPTPAAKSTAASTSAQGVKTVAATPSATAKPAVRDWAAIDTNKDNLISPDEMQKHLQEQWAAQKKVG